MTSSNIVRSLTWYLAWNVGTCMYMIWTGVACLNQFINSVVWKSDDIIRAPVWCDICRCSPLAQLSSYCSHCLVATMIMVGSSVAIPAASLCINRRLYKIASVQSVTTPRAQRRREIITDLAIGVGIPILVILLRGCCRINSTSHFY